MTLHSKDNMSMISTNGGISRSAHEDITDTSDSGGYTLEVENDIDIKSNAGMYRVVSFGDIDITANSDLNLYADGFVFLGGTKLKVNDSLSIYGTEEPNNTVVPNPEEGTLYFRLLD